MGKMRFTWHYKVPSFTLEHGTLVESLVRKVTSKYEKEMGNSCDINKVFRTLRL